MSNTIEDFRNFFMPNGEKEVFEVNKYVESAYKIIRATLVYHHIEVEIIKPKESISIYGYPSEFSQVILNLLDNAKDILLKREIESPKIVIEAKVENSYLVVSVRDNAGGIDEDISKDIFNIYFTTKGKDGTGLGLYISKLIIENKFMGDIYSVNGEKGAEFFIKIKL